MKFSLTFLTIILVGQNCYTQNADNTDRHNEKNIYFQALRYYLEFRMSDSFYFNSKPIDTLYVYSDTKTTDSLLDKIGSTRIIMIDDPYSFIKKRPDKAIILYSIFPLDFENDEFWVSLVPFRVTIDEKRRKNLLFSNPGSYKVVFKYESGEFIYIRLEVHGI